MFKIKKDHVVRALLFLSGCLMIFAGVWFKWNATPTARPLKVIVAENKRHDFSVLNQAKAPEDEVAEALVRMGELGEEIARQEAIKRSKDSSPVVRMGCAGALGYFRDSSSLATLLELSKDRDPGVKSHALRSIGQSWQDRPKEALEALIQKAALKPIELVELYSGLIQSKGVAPELKHQAIQKIVALVENQEGDSSSRFEAISQLMSVAPENPVLLNSLREELHAHLDSALSRMGLRHLAQVGDPWMAKNMKGFLHAKDRETRLVAVQAIPQVCPKDRFELLEGVLRNEKDPLILKAALEAPALMPGPGSVGFLNRVIASEGMTEEKTMEVRELLFRVQHNYSVDPCVR